MRGRTWWRPLLALCIFAFWIPAATGQEADPPVARSAWSGGTHTWLIFEDGEGGSVLAHCPPRRAGREGTFAPSDPGTLRVARRLASVPLGLAGVGDEVFLLLPPLDDRPAYVASIKAVPPAMGDYWVYFPQRRMTPLPPLPDGFEAESIAATGLGPAVLGRLGDQDTVCIRVGAGWSVNPFPEGRRGALPIDTDDHAAAFLRPLSAEAGERITLRPGDPPERSAIAFPGGEGSFVRGWARGGRVVLITKVEGQLRAHALSEEAPELLGTVGPAPERVTTGISVGGGVLIAAWAGEDGEPGGVELVELSLTTGAELYAGPAVNAMPISPAQFRLLAAALVALMALVLLVVLVPVREQPVVLPPDTALAEPGRRLVATVIDGLLSAFVVSVVYGVPVLHILTFRVLVEPTEAWSSIIGVLLVGFLIGSVGEGVFGRSPGKALTGCRVIRAHAAGGSVRAGLGRSILRNALKWGAPPVAALTLVDPSGRSRADVLTGLAVVVDPEKTPPEPGDED
ncbi:MAG: RDD family protein [Phycisphaerales bacterium JB059]